MAKTVDELTVHVRMPWWFDSAVKVLAVASWVMPAAWADRAVDYLADYLCDRIVVGGA